MTPTSTVAIDLAAATTAAGERHLLRVAGRRIRGETFNNDALLINGKTYLSTFGVEFVHHKTTKDPIKTTSRKSGG
jgi:hypothetical protein